MSEPTINFSIQTQHAQFSVPNELIKKNFKAIQKLVEKQKKQITDEIAKIKRDPTMDSQQKLAIIRKLIKNFESLQKKIEQAIKKDDDYRKRFRARTHHLAKLEKFVVSTPKEMGDKEEKADDKVLDLHNEGLINWYREVTNLLIIDYLIKSNNRKESNLGIKLMRSLQATSFPQIAELIDYDVYENFNQVYLSINDDHDLDLISAWYNENRNSLKRINSNLQFEIHYCKYLSMVEKGEVAEAIEYCKTNLAPYANRSNYNVDDLINYEQNKKRLTEVGAPLVYLVKLAPETKFTSDYPWKSLLKPSEKAPVTPMYLSLIKLFSDSRWKGLSQCFTEDFTKIYGLSNTYPLLVYLSAGISSLKTKSCYCNQQNTIFKSDAGRDVSLNLDSNSYRDLSLRGPNQYYKLLHKINQCPVCSPELYRLSQNLPYAQLITSIFDNPFKLPNGNIYPFDKLLNPIDKAESENVVRKGKVQDPLTQEIFFIDDCVRVFPA
ncbi:CIC11C00000005144 [Sungouiella intermedia]|uniref:CIC11C00000005144 n=1 Tax=Sungouiella intermedia TaxID=45354 RepID=A0A1L0BZB8_9ASCO|nr:CIC11C00000005144 [[Candida] intermedia]